MRGLGVAVVDIFAVILLRLRHETAWDVRGALPASASLLLGATGRIPVIVILALAGLVGILCF